MDKKLLDIVCCPLTRLPLQLLDGTRLARLNSAIEAVVDRWGPEWHGLAGRAKDMGSAAVFLADMNVLLCWGVILGPRWLV